MRNILLPVHDDGGQEARLQAALDIARATSGHLICLEVVQLPVPAGGDLLQRRDAPLREPGRMRGSDHAFRLGERLIREHVDWEMLQATGGFAESVIRRSGLADVIVLNRKFSDSASEVTGSATSAISLDARKPVVAVAESSEGFDIFGRVLVAWDGSMACMAALTAAAPLLKWAMSVTLLEVDTGDIPVRAEEAATYLSRHEIHANIRRIAGRSGEVGFLIEEALSAHGAAYCVMGACGHSPVHEAILGGVTRQILTTSPVPVILAR